ncbi:hypothetical protein [Mitsuaria sp. GD03876]|uniref:hypothetical protein n=1 Tax=Mitsuaria sp. GD03876 TaxID=2975399 RepID=UPI0024490B92|nr:hypothetical protein [Mitsuaria sp. GD03876]MDH0867100.1 hypothetical protein [Mitsuaria sp. GD03876]
MPPDLMPLYHLPPSPVSPSLATLPPAPAGASPSDEDTAAPTPPPGLQALERRWARSVAAHALWSRQAPVVPLLLDWLRDADPIARALGPAMWRHFAQHLLQHASTRDLRAMGLDERVEARVWTSWPEWRTAGFRIADAPGRLHRAVVWWEDGRLPEYPEDGGVFQAPYGAALWLDGRLMPYPQELTFGCSINGSGEWIDDRYFVVDVDGPPEHPDYVEEKANGRGSVLSLLVVDARHRSCHLLNPRAHEPWLRPRISVQADGRWRIDPGIDPDAETATATDLYDEDADRPSVPSRLMLPSDLPPASIEAEVPDDEAEPRSLAPAWRHVVDAWNADGARLIGLLGEMNYELALDSFRDAALGW